MTTSRNATETTILVDLETYQLVRIQDEYHQIESRNEKPKFESKPSVAIPSEKLWPLTSYKIGAQKDIPIAKCVGMPE